MSVALKITAIAIIIAHTHQSGNLKPSVQDLDVTRRIQEGGKILEIRLLDHLILSPVDREFKSFGDKGLL